MSEIEKLVERLRNDFAPYWEREAKMCLTPEVARAYYERADQAREAAATLQSQARRVEELEGALRVFAAIVPSSLHPADGSEAEAYVIMLHDPKMLGQGGAPDFTGADLARARSALSEGSGSSLELAPPDESGDACGATERAEG